ncbi:uncharacterized protein [Asterias amurensis]|uniref:uncharacterized protein n=1 Tax=Asterias amurensis TaxID=7602 RepID=UPI003AB81060
MACGHGPLTNHPDTVSHAIEAETTGKTVFGVKGATWLLKCPMFDVITGVSVDYMHCVCICVTKKLIRLWTNTEYKRCPCYVGSSKEEIDKRLLLMTPTNRISRLPRTINLNKDLRILFHGTQNVAQQIIQAVSVHQKIPEMVNQLCERSKVLAFYEQMYSYHRIKSVLTEVCFGIHAIGTLKRCTVKKEVYDKILDMFSFVGDLIIYKFERLMLNKTVIHSKVYKAVSRRNSYTSSIDSCHRGMKVGTNLGTPDFWVSLNAEQSAIERALNRAL